MSATSLGWIFGLPSSLKPLSAKGNKTLVFWHSVSLSGGRPHSSTSCNWPSGSPKEAIGARSAAWGSLEQQTGTN
eukprot:2280927-Alexandrium_andersonii.AAC.1